MSKQVAETKEVIARLRPQELDMLVDTIKFTTNLRDIMGIQLEGEDSMQELNDQPIFNEEGRKLLQYLEDLQFKYDIPSMKQTLQ
ncbi:MAG: hypothetical protein VW270_01975 [Candidatus Poseidoniales archaeon]|jgi:hypothetical protein